MIKIVFTSGLLLCAGSGFAAYSQLNPGTSVSSMTQAAMQYLGDTPARIKLLLSNEEPEAARPRIALATDQRCEYARQHQSGGTQNARHGQYDGRGVPHSAGTA